MGSARSERSEHRGLSRRGDPKLYFEAGHGFADYLPYVDGRAMGVVEAKKEGVTLTGVETQSEKHKESKVDSGNLIVSGSTSDLV